MLPEQETEINGSYKQYLVMNSKFFNIKIAEFPQNPSADPEEEPIQYFVSNHEWAMKSPDVKFYLGDSDESPVVAVAHLSSFSGNRIGVGIDPSNGGVIDKNEGMVKWEDLKKESTWTHAEYSFSWDVEVPVAGSAPTPGFPSNNPYGGQYQQPQQQDDIYNQPQPTYGSPAPPPLPARNSYQPPPPQSFGQPQQTRKERKTFLLTRTKTRSGGMADQGDMDLTEKGGNGDILAQYKGFGIKELKTKRAVATIKMGYGNKEWERAVWIAMATCVELSRRRSRARR